MGTVEWIQMLLPEIAISEGGKMGWDEFWTAVERTKPDDKVEQSNVNKFIDFENKSQVNESKDVKGKEGENQANKKQKCTNLNKAMKKWFWGAFVLLDEVILTAENDSKRASDELKNFSYETMESTLKDKIRFELKEKTKNTFLYGHVKPSVLPDIHREIIAYILKFRHNGIVTTELCKTFKKNQGKLHSVLKLLTKLGLVVQNPVVYNKVYTNINIHIQYACKNAINQAMNDPNGTDELDAAKEIKENGIIDVTFVNKDIKEIISNILENADQNIITYKDIYSLFEIGHYRSNLAKKLLRVCSYLIKAGYISRVKVPDENDKLLNAIKLIKPYKKESSQKVGSISTDFEFFSEIPMEQQVYKLIHNSRENGILRMEICDELMNMGNRQISNLLALLTEQTKNQPLPPCVSEWEFDGRKRMLRFFTREAYEIRDKKKKISSNNYESNDQLIDNEISKTKVKVNKSSTLGSITMDLREGIILEILNQSKVKKVDLELLNLVQGKMKSKGVKSDLCKKTLNKTLKYLEDNQIITISEFDVENLKGNVVKIQLIHLKKIKRGDPDLEKEIEAHCDYIKNLCHNKLKSPEIIRDYKALKMDKGKEQIGIEAENKYSMKRLASLSKFRPKPKRFPNESEAANDASSSAFYVSVAQRFGYVRSKLLRVKILHLHIVELFEKIESNYKDKRVIPESFFLNNFNLEVLLKIVIMKYPSQRLIDYCTQPENLKLSLSQIDKDIYTELIGKSMYILKLLDQVKIIEAFELLIPLTNKQIEDMELVGNINSKSKASHVYNNATHPSFYVLPKKFKSPISHLDIMKDSSLEDLKACKDFWDELECQSFLKTFQYDNKIDRRETYFSRLGDKQATLKGILYLLKNPSNWRANYLFTLEQRKKLDSLVDFEEELTPFNDVEIIDKYSKEFNLPWSAIRGYFFKYEKRFNEPKGILMKRGSKYYKSKRRDLVIHGNNDNTSGSETDVQEMINGNHKVDQFYERKDQIKLSDKLLLSAAILTFRFNSNLSLWFKKLKKLFPSMSESSLNKWVTEFIKDESNQIKIKGLVEKWKHIYTIAIKNKTLKENINEQDGENGDDPESDLAKNGFPEDFDIIKQYRLFKRKLNEPNVKGNHPLASTTEELYDKYNIKLNLSLNSRYQFKVNHYFIPKIGRVSGPNQMMSYDMPSIGFRNTKYIPKHLQTVSFYKDALVILDFFVTKSFALHNIPQFSGYNHFNLDDPSAALFLYLNSNQEGQPDLDQNYVRNHDAKMAKLAIKMIVLYNTCQKVKNYSSLSSRVSLSLLETKYAVKNLMDDGVLSSNKSLNQVKEMGLEKENSFAGKKELEIFQEIDNLVQNEKDDSALISAIKEVGSNQEIDYSILGKRYVLAERLTLSLIGSYPKTFTEDARKYSLSLTPSKKDKLNIVPENITESMMVVLISLICDSKINITLTSPTPSTKSSDQIIGSNGPQTRIYFKFFRELSLKELSSQIEPRIKRESISEISFGPNKPIIKRSKVELVIQPGEQLVSLCDSLSDNKIKERIQNMYKFIDSFGVNGVSMALLVCCNQDLRYEELNHCINLLENYCIPLIYQVGYDVPRYVTYTYYKDWTVNLQPDSSEIKNEFSIIPRPWLDLNGNINNEVYSNLQNVVLSHIVRFPGLLKATLAKYTEFILSKPDLDAILEPLLNKGVIYSRSFIQPDQPNLFSKRGFAHELAPNLKSKLTHPFQITCYYPATDYYSRL